MEIEFVSLYPINKQNCLSSHARGHFLFQLEPEITNSKIVSRSIWMTKENVAFQVLAVLAFRAHHVFFAQMF